MGIRSLALLAPALAAACVSSSPEVPTPGHAADAGTVYADVVLAYTQEGQPQTCQQALPACGDEPGETCGPPAVLGPPDSMTYELENGGRLDLGFRCGAVVEHGGEGSADVTIWATVPEGASAVVEASQDGVTYETWVTLSQSNQELDLATIEQTYLRYLRIADTGGGGILIDAVEGI
jgi:hypothetical protein